MALTLFSELPAVGISGLGHALPPTTRDEHSEAYALTAPDNPFRGLFTGYGSRRVLGEDESLAELMALACRVALDDASCPAEAVGLLTGFASVSEFLAPNELFHVHRCLRLPNTSEVLPVADEFTAFLSGLRLAAERIWTDSLGAALVTCGSRWSSNVDYRDPVSVSIGDGAGAALVKRLSEGGPSGMRLLGWNSVVPEGMYGVMRMSPRRGDTPTALTDERLTTRPLFTMLPESEAVFREWGIHVPPSIAAELMQAAGIDHGQVTCIAHQASTYLLDAWRRALPGVHFEDTIQSLGNMTHASIPVTLSLKARTIGTRYLLLLGLGLGVHTSACLLERTPWNLSLP